MSMASEIRFWYQDPSKAIAEAYHQRSLGQRVAVGRDICGKWYVRVLGPTQQAVRA